MDYRDIEYALDGGLATVTLNRPQSMNALTGQMRAEITHAMKRAAREARCVVLTGNGSSFCSGQDLKDAGTRENAPIDLERTLRDEYTPMLEAIYNCPVPTIAAVNGAAAGAGANLALAADVVIACDSAFFLQAFTRIGLMPDAGGTWYLPRQIGLAKAELGNLLDNLHVDGHYHGNGIAKQLMSMATQWLQANAKHPSIYLEVLSGNHHAIKVYEKLGAKRVKAGVWHAPCGSVVDEFVYQWSDKTQLSEY